MDDLIERLRALSRHEHSDYSIGDEAADALEAVREAPVAIMDTREFLSLCAPTEDDFPAIYALQGQRVRIVKEPTHD